MYDPIKLFDKYIVREERLINFDKEFPNSIIKFDLKLFLYKSIVREERLINFDKEFPNSIMLHPVVFRSKFILREEKLTNFDK